jgi:chromosome segregation ATPase
MQPGTSFLHAPADLRRFDADEVRLGLQVHNRECDRAHRAAIASEDVADRLTDEKEAIRVDRDRLHADLVHLRDHLATLDAELERLRAERHEWHRERLEMSERLVLADKALVDIQASRSWRLTAPLRWVFERLARR